MVVTDTREGIPVLIRFVIYYILMSILLTFFVTFAYVQYIGATHIVAGKIFTPSRALVTYCLLKSSTLVAIFIPLVAIIFTIRHYNPCVIITCGVLSIATYAIALPMTQIIKNNVIHSLDIAEFEIGYNDNIPVSGGYFRKNEHNIYYFISDSYRNHSHVIELYNDGRAPVRYGYTPPTADQIRYPRELYVNVGNDSFYAKEAFPYRDTIFTEVLDNKEQGFLQVSSILDISEIVLFSTQKAWNSGPIAWLLFLSMPFCMLSTVAFCRASSWKLINFMSCVVTYILIFYINTLYYMEVFSPVRKFLALNVSRRFVEPLIKTGFLNFVSSNIDDFTLALINIVCCAAILLVGIFGTHKRLIRDRA